MQDQYLWIQEDLIKLCCWPNSTTILRIYFIIVKRWRMGLVDELYTNKTQEFSFYDWCSIILGFIFLNFFFNWAFKFLVLLKHMTLNLKVLVWLSSVNFVENKFSYFLLSNPTFINGVIDVYLSTKKLKSFEGYYL